MSQATILQGLIMFFIIVLYVINTARKSSKQEARSHPPRVSREVHAKPASLKNQEVTAEEKEDSSSILRKKSTSRSKKILNKSLLRQSILRAEILRKKH